MAEPHHNGIFGRNGVHQLPQQSPHGRYLKRVVGLNPVLETIYFERLVVVFGVAEVEAGLRASSM